MRRIAQAKAGYADYADQTHFFAELPDKPAISATVLPQLDLFLYSGNFADQDIPQPDFVAFIYGHAGVNFVHFNAKAALWPLGDSFIVPLLTNPHGRG